MEQFEQPDQPPSSGGDIASRVKAPAIALMITAGIGMVFQIIGLLMNLLGAGVGAAEATTQQEQWMAMTSGGVGVVSSIVGLVIGVVVLLGALKMMKLQSWGFALAAAILAMIPCVSPCCLLGIPFGIWAIVVLTKADVKAAFN